MLETFNSADKTLVLRSNHVSKDFFVKMTKCRENGHFIDINLICGEESDEEENNIQVEIPAHKIILSCCSPYFETMFCGNFTENNSNLAKIYIGGVTSQALIDIIQYFYTGILKIDQENVMELLEVADVLLLEQVSYNKLIPFFKF